ncbi:MAG: hypothetical protein QM803_14650 [Rhodocyclaceae bacterium]
MRLTQTVQGWWRPGAGKVSEQERGGWWKTAGVEPLFAVPEKVWADREAEATQVEPAEAEESLRRT